MSSEQGSLKSGKSSSKLNDLQTSTSSVSKINSNHSKISAGNSFTNLSRGLAVPKMEILQPGTVLTVGSHIVEVVNYLSEGGFAHIYVVKFLEYVSTSLNLSTNLNVGDVLCLKRVFCMDQNGLNELRMEVDTMKKLMNCSRIVKYYDSNATKLSYVSSSNPSLQQQQQQSIFNTDFNFDGTNETANQNQKDQSDENGFSQSYFEVLVLMELCPNKSLLDYMNDRLKTKLNNGDVLNIMLDISRALYEMHCRPEPLIHKDIKIENVLVDKDMRFKLCDFGSTTQCYPMVTSHQDIALLANDIYVHTTPQYRSPEMIDLYKCLPINEKSDIWALGIFLYKLLFYTTPFELTGQFAILHSKYEIPVNNYLSGLNNLIIIMLSENPSLRPNIYQVLFELCTMMKIDIPSKYFDYYGQGPYDFNKYSQYQANLHSLQYQMFMMHQQKKMNNSEMYLNVFEVASKQPINMGKNSQPLNGPIGVVDNMQNIPNEANQYHQSSKSISSKISVSETSTTPVVPLEKSVSSTKEPSIDIEELNKKYPSVEDLLADRDNVRKSVGETSTPIPTTTPHSMVSNNSNFDNQNSSTNNIIQKSKSANTIKQHKSNNPFPKMSLDKSQTGSSANPTNHNTSDGNQINDIFFEQNNNRKYSSNDTGPYNTLSNNIHKEDSSKDIFGNIIPQKTPSAPVKNPTHSRGASLFINNVAPNYSQSQSTMNVNSSASAFTSETNLNSNQTLDRVTKSSEQEKKSLEQKKVEKPSQKLELTFANMDLRGNTPEYEVSEPNMNYKKNKRKSLNYRRDDAILNGAPNDEKYDMDLSDETAHIDYDENDDFEHEDTSVSQESIAFTRILQHNINPSIDGETSSSPRTTNVSLPRRSLNLRISEVDFDQKDQQRKNHIPGSSNTKNSLFPDSSEKKTTTSSSDIFLSNNDYQNYSSSSSSSKKSDVETSTRSVSNTLTLSSNGNNTTYNNTGNRSVIGSYDQVLIPKNRQPAKSENTVNSNNNQELTGSVQNTNSAVPKKKSLDLRRDEEIEEIHSLGRHNSISRSLSHSHQTHGTSKHESHDKNTTKPSSSTRRSFQRLSRKSLDLDNDSESKIVNDAISGHGPQTNTSSSNATKRRSIFGKFTKGF